MIAEVIYEWSVLNERIRWKLTDVTIVSVRVFTVAVESYRGETEIEEIKFSFKRIEWEYISYNAEKKTVVGGWNVESDTEIPPPAAVKDFKDR